MRDEGQNGAPDRQTSTLPGRARLAQSGEGDEPGDERVKRAREPIEQLAADVARHGGVGAVVRARRHQFGGAALARALHRGHRLGELGKVDRVIVERSPSQNRRRLAGRSSTPLLSCR